MIKKQKLQNIKHALISIHFIALDVYGSRKETADLYDLAVAKAEKMLNRPSKYYKAVKQSYLKLDNRLQRDRFVFSFLRPICNKCNVDYNKIRDRYFNTFVPYTPIEDYDSIPF